MIGFHVQKREAHNWLKDDIQRVRPCMVKLLDPDHWEHQPFGDGQITYVGRYVTAREQNYWQDGAEGARAWFAEIRPRLQRWVPIVEHLNEPVLPRWPDGQHAAIHHVAFTLEATRLLHEEGYLSGVGCWSMGEPQMEYWEILAEEYEGAGYNVRHEYSKKTMLMQPDDWLLLRYRKDRAELAKYGVAQPPTLITECGIDTGGGPDKGGWRAVGMDRTTYAHRLVDVLREYERDGAVGFGYTWNHWRWPSFDIDSRLSKLIVERYLSLAARPPIVVPKPPVVEVPSPPQASFFPWRVSQRWGENPAYYAQYGLLGHNGEDFALDNWQLQHGAQMRTPWSGNLVYGYSDGYGIYAYLDSGPFYALWAHLAYSGEASGRVERGDVVGHMGYTGNTEPKGQPGTHLHFGIRPKPLRLDNGMRGYVDPGPYIRGG